MAPAAASTAISTRPGFFRSVRASATGSDATVTGAAGAAGALSPAAAAGLATPATGSEAPPRPTPEPAGNVGDGASNRSGAVRPTSDAAGEDGGGGESAEEAGGGGTAGGGLFLRGRGAGRPG